MRSLKSLLAAVLTVVMIASLSVSAFAAYENITYDDVDEMYGTTLSNINTTYIKFVDSLGIISGTKNGNFMPEMNVTRGEALKIAYRMLHGTYDELEDYSMENTPFDENGDEGDISDVSLLKPYLAWALDYQLINSEYVPNKKFESNKNITAEEFITLITKTLGISVEEDNEDTYKAFQEAVLDGSELDASAQVVNREQAAIIVARAMVYDPEIETSEDLLTTFADMDGNRLNCLATNVYGCNVTELIVRATRETPLNYKVTEDVLLSNGTEISVDADFSSYIGYPINLIYTDLDGSDTFTPDEKMLSYEILSPLVGKFSLSDVKMFDHAYFTATGSTAFYVYPQAMMYLNGDVWPSDPIYDLNSLPTLYGKPASLKTVTNRPNLEFTFVQNSMANVDVVMAKEWIPGRVMAVTDNYVSIFSYYTNDLLTYEDKDLVLNQVANIKTGDYINYYEGNDKLYLSEGTIAELATYKINEEGNLVGKTPGENGINVSYTPHLYKNLNMDPIEGMTGDVIAVLDSTGKTFLAVEEKIVTEETAIELMSATFAQDNATVTVKGRDWTTGEEVTLTVETDRIETLNGELDTTPGNVYTYAKTAGGKVNMYAVDRVEMTAIESEDYFIVGGEQKYLKAPTYTDDSEAAIVGKVTLLIDHNKAVWAAYTK